MTGTDTLADALEGERIRYSGDTWELTGSVEIRANGELLFVEARQPERVRGGRGRLKFVLDGSSASINPGNLGEFSVELDRLEGTPSLLVERPHGVTRYRLESLRSG